MAWLVECSDMFMLSCIFFFSFTWVQTSKLNEFTAGLTSRIAVDIQLTSVPIAISFNNLVELILSP